MEALKQHLKSKPSIKMVYFNENEEYLFYPRPSFTTAMTREEILGEKEEASEVEETKKGKKK